MSEQSEVPVGVQEKPKPVQNKPQNPARRSFLNGLAGLVGLAAVGQIPDISRNVPTKVENKERVVREPKLAHSPEVPLNPQTLVLDFLIYSFYGRGYLN